MRVDARRLRDRLREYYASAPDDPVVISVPKGSYKAEFHIKTPTPAAGAQTPERVSIEPLGGGTAIPASMTDASVEPRARSLGRCSPVPQSF